MRKQGGAWAVAINRILVALLLAVLAPSVAVASPSATGLGGTFRHFHRGWSFSVAAGGLTHSGVTSRGFDDTQTDIAMVAGLARSLGSRVLFEFGPGLSIARSGLANPSLVEARARWIWYPAALRQQRDQPFLLGGGTLVLARHHTGRMRRGAGLEAGLGMDCFVGGRTSVFAEFGIGPVWLSRDPDLDVELGPDVRLPDQPMPRVAAGALIHLILGARIGL
jgi:hypothetical protein